MFCSVIRERAAVRLLMSYSATTVAKTHIALRQHELWLWLWWKTTFQLWNFGVCFYTVVYQVFDFVV